MLLSYTFLEALLEEVGVEVELIAEDVEDVEVEEFVLVMLVLVVEAIGVAAAAANPVRLKRDRKRISNN